jgi:hypothetical protein
MFVGGGVLDNKIKELDLLGELAGRTVRAIVAE